MTHIVVDTNVFVHSSNPNNAYFAQAGILVENISSSDCLLCVDEGLHENEAQNASSIWAEYMEHVPKASLAAELLAQLLLTARIEDFPKKTDKETHRAIRAEVNDPTDIVFVKICYNSASLALVSHDEVAFPEDARAQLRQQNIANIVDCYGLPAL